MCPAPIRLLSRYPVIHRLYVVPQPHYPSFTQEIGISYEKDSIKTERAARLHDWTLRGRPEAEWKVWLALDMYNMMAEQFGWQSYTNVIKKYRTMEKQENEQEVLSSWAHEYILETKHDLCDFFAWWRHTIWPKTRELCATLPKMATDPLEEFRKRKSGVEAQVKILF